MRANVANAASLAIVVGLLSCQSRAATSSTADATAAGAQQGEVVESVLDSASGLAQGWADFGYCPHKIAKGKPAELDLASYGGLILARPDISGHLGGLAFRYRAPDSFGDFLEVQLQTHDGKALARVPVERSRAKRASDGFYEVWLPWSELDPGGERFERVMFFARRPVGHELVLLDRVGFTAAPLEPARSAYFAIDCRAAGRAISPLIYGVGGSDGAPWALGATARRWGGNPTSRYNWELNTWNVGNDWFFRNAGGKGPGYDGFLDADLKHGVKSALTVPLLGWVAKDGTSYSFPVSTFGPQQATAGDLPDAGNGVSRSGKLLAPGPPTATSVRSTPESIERWVRAIRAKDQKRGRSVSEYILGNEPMLWDKTHRDVHPAPATYDELLEKTIAYASAIRRADPEATIAGPAAWGWLGYHYSARDVAVGVRLRPDRRLHGDIPLVPWYLRKLSEYEKKTGTRLLDVLDVHFYPMAKGIGIGKGGETDPATAALRIRSTRSLWDPSYVDESWIDERMRVLPLLSQWVNENYPGRGISIGEWNFGAETHMSGGLAAAEALGRFGEAGLTSAFYWTEPPDRSPAFWAFRAYRNFDGSGGRFLDWSVPVQSDGSLVSLFASRDADRRRVVAVLLNFAPLSPVAARVDLEACGEVGSARAFTYAGGRDGFEKLDAAEAHGIVSATVAPYTMTVFDLTLTPASEPGPR
jgi:hypothetical protein